MITEKLETKFNNLHNSASRSNDFGQSRALLLISVLIAILPILIAATFVFSFAVNLPIWDDWDLFPLFAALSHNPFSPEIYLLQKHGDHILFVPQLIIFCIGSFCKFNMISAMWGSIAFLAAINVSVIFMFRSYLPWQLRSFAFLAPVSWILCNLRQWDNFLQAYQLCMFCLCFFVLMTFACLRKAQQINGYFLGAAFCALISSLSFNVGILTWPLGALQMHMQGAEERRSDIGGKRWSIFSKVKLLFVWCLMGLICSVLFFKNCSVDPLWHETINLISTDWTRLPVYFLAIVGNPFACELIPQMAFGITLITLLLMTVWTLAKNDRKQFSKQAALFMLVLFGLGYCLLVTFGRLHLGMHSASYSRYSTVSLLGFAGFYILVVSNYLKSPNNFKFHFGSLLTLTLLMITIGYPAGVEGGQRIKQQRIVGKIYTQTYKERSDEALSVLYLRPEFLRKEILPLAEKNKWTCFAETVESSNIFQPTVSFSAPCIAGSYSLDKINNKLAEPGSEVIFNSTDTSSIRWSGWAVDPASHKLAYRVMLSIDGKIVHCQYGISRPDVALYFQNKNVSNCGFIATVPISNLRPGSHQVSLIIVGQNQIVYEEPNLHSLVIL